MKSSFLANAGYNLVKDSGVPSSVWKLVKEDKCNASISEGDTYKVFFIPPSLGTATIIKIRAPMVVLASAIKRLHFFARPSSAFL